ncbi:MAG: hypothetical protein NVSMB32_15060 [Actinomycetota bacterium]
MSAVIDLAHALGMTVVAEGVETAGQREQLAGLGCDACQGYYFAKPMAADTLEILIQQLRAGGTMHLPAFITAADPHGR